MVRDKKKRTLRNEGRCLHKVKGFPPWVTKTWFDVSLTSFELEPADLPFTIGVAG
jgi:hypothetical protein